MRWLSEMGYSEHTRGIDPYSNKMKTPSVFDILRVMEKKRYRVFESDNNLYNLNLIGIRADNPVPNSFDDRFFVLWKLHGRWHQRDYAITTDPGTYWLKNPMNVSGTAILKEGQYPGLWALGKHAGYDALIQVSPCTVIRDANRNNRLDYDGHEETGLFGINLHRANPAGKSTQVDKWSAGCQVFADGRDFQMFMQIAKEAARIWGDGFSYTLLNERDFKG